MTEPPQDDERRSDDGPGHASGQPTPPQQLGPPGRYGPPAYGEPAAPQQPSNPPYGQPDHYGPPPQYAPYGAPGQFGAPQAPGRKSRVGLIAGLTAALLVLIAVGVVLAMNLGPTVLDRTAVERDVAAQFEQLEGVAIDLRCPEEMKVESGAEYSCTGTTADGEEVELAIRIGDKLNGDYTWTEV
jgi:hypothetical protein